MSEKGDTSAKYLCVKYHDPSSSGSPDTLLTTSFMDLMRKSEKGNNSIKYSQNFMKR